MGVDEALSRRADKPSSRRGKKRARKPQPASMQRLYDACREVFSRGENGGVPSPTDVERLCSLLDQIEGKDVNVTESMPYFGKVGKEAGMRPPITYIRLHEGDDFSICIFCLPQSSVIPLHNHPGMTVFSRLLFGTLHVKSYDWVDADADADANADADVGPHPNDDQGSTMALLREEPAATAGRVRLAKVVADGILRYPHCRTSVLYPASGGNMHRFTALTPCAVLDVLGPPYSKDGCTRPCTYYDDHAYSLFGAATAAGDGNGAETYAWLEARDNIPDGFSVESEDYTGPAILVQS